MGKNDMIKYFKRSKTIQLVILILFELTFFFILTVNRRFRDNIFTNNSLFIICVVVWSFMIFCFIFILYDFIKMREFAKESHVLNQTAYLDNLTGIPNRNSCDLIFKRFQTPESLASLGCFMLSISNLEDTNTFLGHVAGDKLIQDFCSIFEKVGDEFGFVCRNGGNEYIAILEHCDTTQMQLFVKELNRSLKEYNLLHDSAPIKIMYGYVLNAEFGTNDFQALLSATYKQLQ